MSAALDVAIGLAFVYLLLALFVTTLQELLATWFGLRARQLYAALRDMLGSQYVAELYAHPLVRNLAQKVGAERPLPSYIPSKVFALALLDVLEGKRSVSQVTGLDEKQRAAADLIGEIAVQSLKNCLELFKERADAEVKKLDDTAARFAQQLETLFNDRMARASGWYKRRAQCIALSMALALTLLFNVDTIYVGRRLWNDAALRETIVASAQAHHDTRSQRPPTTEDQDALATTRALTKRLVAQTNELRGIGFPISWDLPPASKALGWQDVVLKLMGLLMTALAVSLGATFWFDVLGRFLQLRGTGPKIATSPRGSE